jgi:hypothetical protein
MHWSLAWGLKLFSKLFSAITEETFMQRVKHLKINTTLLCLTVCISQSFYAEVESPGFHSAILQHPLKLKQHVQTRAYSIRLHLFID